MKNFLFLIWTVICVLSVIALSVLVTKSQNFTGTDITFSTSESQQFTINAPSPVTIEAAASNFFAFRNGSETVIGKLDSKPLGWNGEYFSVGPVEIQNGTWIGEKGYGVTVHLNSAESMAVQKDLKVEEKMINITILILVSIVVWFATLLLLVIL